MNHGVLEQVGPPEELYERPANRFVAGFIGSPAMSFLDAAVSSDGNGGLVLRGEGVDLVLPRSGELPASVTVGIRPEHARRWNGRPDLIGPLRGQVAFVEALGRETFLGVDVGDGARVVVFEEGRAAVAPGDSIEFGFVASGLRYFAPDTGAAL
jgi:ABC-type sugar transport system ATPase subunit